MWPTQSMSAVDGLVNKHAQVLPTDTEDIEVQRKFFTKTDHPMKTKRKDECLGWIKM